MNNVRLCWRCLHEHGYDPGSLHFVGNHSLQLWSIRQILSEYLNK